MCEKQNYEDVHISEREIPRKLSELTRHTVVQKNNEKTKKKQHARLPAQMPASGVSRSPGGNNRQERKDGMSSQKDGKHQADSRAGKTGARRRKRRVTIRSSATCGCKKAMVPWE